MYASRNFFSIYPIDFRWGLGRGFVQANLANMYAYTYICIQMLWGCITGDSVGPLHKLAGIMNQYMYKGILKEHLPNCM